MHPTVSNAANEQGILTSSGVSFVTYLQAMVHPYFPYFRVDVTALVFVFQPAVGARLSEHLHTRSLSSLHSIVASRLALWG